VRVTGTPRGEVSISISFETEKWGRSPISFTTARAGESTVLNRDTTPFLLRHDLRVIRTPIRRLSRQVASGGGDLQWRLRLGPEVVRAPARIVV
jgi:hypothetical protein